MSMYNVYRDKLPRSSHNIGKPRYFDMDMGILTPFYIRELYPGDSVKISNSVFIETRTLKVPLKNRIRFRQYWFFVPYRLMWKNWEKFIFGGKSGDFTADFPYMLAYSSGGDSSSTLLNKKSLWSMLGFPQFNSLSQTNIRDFLDKLKVSAMPFAAYQMIYKDWFRDENLSGDYWDFENAGQAWLADGANIYARNEDGSSTPINLFTVRHAPWSRTYFTAALPFRQRGTANRVPLSGSAFLKSFISEDSGQTYTVTPITYRTIENSDGTNRFVSPAATSVGQTIGQSLQTGIAYSTSDGAFTPGGSQYRALGIDGSDLQGFTITELRLLAKLQQFAEINARFGFRYIEGLRGHFGVSPNDSRLDRPEFICGSSQDVIVAEVLQTSATTDGGTPLATPAGRGVSASGGRLGSYFAQEHGILMGICSIMPEQIYTQGVPRMWTRRTKEEFFSPEFNGLSEQEIRTKEIYATPDMTLEQLNSVLGFVPAWEELRHDTAFANGSLRDPDNQDIYAWTMARHFNSIPTLSENFVMGSQDNENGGIRTDAFATGNATPPFFVSINNKIRLLSTVSKSGTPGITRI